MIENVDRTQGIFHEVVCQLAKTPRKLMARLGWHYEIETDAWYRLKPSKEQSAPEYRNDVVWYSDSLHQQFNTTLGDRSYVLLGLGGRVPDCCDSVIMPIGLWREIERLLKPAEPFIDPGMA